jgi:hypothetical protein
MLHDSLPETPAHHQADESHRILLPIAWGASAFIKDTFPVVATEAAVAYLGIIRGFSRGR